MYTTIIENGEFNFKLKNILNNKKISINKLMRDTNTDYKDIKRIINGEITKIDLFVIARLCNYLDCNLNDLISYTNKKIPQMN